MTTAQFLRNALLAALAFAFTFMVACGDDPTTPNQGGMIDNDNNGIPDNNGHDNNGIADNNGGFVPGFSATIHVTVPEEMVSADTMVFNWNSNDSCQGQSECDLKTTFQGENGIVIITPYWMAIPKYVMVNKHDMTAEVTWDNTETPGQYGLAPVGTYRDPLDHSFVIDFRTEVITLPSGRQRVTLGSRAQLPGAVISGNHFTWEEAEAPASFTGTISDDLRVITIREVTGNGTVFENTLEIVGDPIDPVTGLPYKKNP